MVNVSRKIHVPTSGLSHLNPSATIGVGERSYSAIDLQCELGGNLHQLPYDQKVRPFTSDDKRSSLSGRVFLVEIEAFFAR